MKDCDPTCALAQLHANLVHRLDKTQQAIWAGKSNAIWHVFWIIRVFQQCSSRSLIEIRPIFSKVSRYGQRCQDERFGQSSKRYWRPPASDTTHKYLAPFARLEHL